MARCLARFTAVANLRCCFCERPVLTRGKIEPCSVTKWRSSADFLYEKVKRLSAFGALAVDLLVRFGFGIA